MSNLSLKIWELPHGAQILEAVCNYGNKQNIRFFSPEETKNVMTVLRDKYNNYYVYKTNNEVEVFTPDGHLIEISYKWDFMMLDVSKPGFPPAQAVIEHNLPEFIAGKGLAITVDDRVLRIMNPNIEFEHQSLIVKNPFNLNLVIKEDYL